MKITDNLLVQESLASETGSKRKLLPFRIIGADKMLVAVGVTALGVLLVGLSSQLLGYRLGGSITVPVLAVYTLKNVFMFPIFLLSTLLAFLGLHIIKQRTLIYGRQELLVAMGIGSLIPLGLLTALWTLLPESLRSVVFIGSILPGLAAYNYSRIKPGYQKWDVITTIVLYTVLIGIGWILVSEPFAPYLANSTPAVLYSPTADIAIIKGVAVATELEPTILQRPVAVLVFGFGVLLSERTRTRYGVRTGMMAMALLAVYALASLWLIGLYFVVIVIAYLGLRVVHHVTLLYGRVLIAAATVTALLAIVPATLALPVSRGLSAYFVAILAGVNAYSWHVTAPTKRDLFVPLQVGSFLSILVVMEVISLVRPDLIPQVYELPVIVGAALVTVVCLVYVEFRATLLPDEDRVFESSILSGGGEA